MSKSARKLIERHKNAKEDFTIKLNEMDVCFISACF